MSNQHGISTFSTRSNVDVARLNSDIVYLVANALNCLPALLFYVDIGLAIHLFIL
jgi:hypothetical protein